MQKSADEEGENKKETKSKLIDLNSSYSPQFGSCTRCWMFVIRVKVFTLSKVDDKSINAI